MKGRILKNIQGDWVVRYIIKPRSEENEVAEIGVLKLYPDNIDSRIANNTEVEFEIIPCIPPDLEPTRGETLSFEAIKYAKLI